MKSDVCRYSAQQTLELEGYISLWCISINERNENVVLYLFAELKQDQMVNITQNIFADPYTERKQVYILNSTLPSIIKLFLLYIFYIYLCYRKR